jgi:hypothetical protein
MFAKYVVKRFVWSAASDTSRYSKIQSTWVCRECTLLPKMTAAGTALQAAMQELERAIW